MRILLDNCVPRRLEWDIAGHTVHHVLEYDWDQLGDGATLDAMAGHFDVLVTVDRSIRFQQRMKNRSFGLVVLRAKSNRLAHLRPLIPALLAALVFVKPGDIVEVN